MKSVTIEMLIIILHQAIMPDTTLSNQYVNHTSLYLLITEMFIIILHRVKQPDTVLYHQI